MTSGGMTLVCLGAMLGPPVADAVDTTSDASEASAAESTSRAAGDGPGRRRAALDGRWWALELQPGLAVPLGGQLGRMDGEVGFSGRVIALRNRAWRGFYLATGPVLHYAFFRRDDDAVLHAPTLGVDGRIGGAHRYFTIYGQGTASGGFFVFDERGDAERITRGYGRLGLGGGFTIFPLRWLGLGMQADWFYRSSVDVFFTLGFHFGRAKKD